MDILLLGIMEGYIGLLPFKILLFFPVPWVEGPKRIPLKKSQESLESLVPKNITRKMSPII